MRFSAAGMVSPPTVTAPISGKLICPPSEMRASTVRSGFWKTVARTTSPGPRIVSIRAGSALVVSAFGAWASASGTASQNSSANFRKYRMWSST